MSIASNGIAADELRALVERIERLTEEKKSLSDDIRDVYAEAKGRGFDVKVIRAVVAMRAKDQSARQEFEAVLELYMEALGMLATTPLGQAATRAFVGGRA